MTDEYILTSSGLGLPPSKEMDTSSEAVINDSVQALAGSIYEEFERMIFRYDANVVKDLMPIIVNVLENYDLSCTESQEYEVEIELLKEDNEQLGTQYEREKMLRRAAEAKNLLVEDEFDAERKDLFLKIESLTSIVKMFELKFKNTSEHIRRLEDKDTETKKEFSKLHLRYTELLKTHVETMSGVRKSKLRGGDSASLQSKMSGMSLHHLSRSNGPYSYGYAELDNSQNSYLEIPDDGTSLSSPDKLLISLKNEMMNYEENNQNSETVNTEKETQRLEENTSKCTKEDEFSESNNTFKEWILEDSQNTETPTPSFSHTKAETRTENTLYQELSFQGSSNHQEEDEETDITGDWVHPGEFASSVSDNYFGKSNKNGFEEKEEERTLIDIQRMGKEVENLINENNELLATKNALNIVKDDLIAKVDELTGEREILREEIVSLQAVRNRLQSRIIELEEEVKGIKEEKEEQGKSDDDNEEMPRAERKRFTRIEMARVLKERNLYKVKFMELQEAVRWMEIMRASKSDGPVLDKKTKHPIWKFFGSLFNGNTRSSNEERLIPFGTNNVFTGDSSSSKALSPTTEEEDPHEIFDKTTMLTNKLKGEEGPMSPLTQKFGRRTIVNGWSLPSSSLFSRNEVDTAASSTQENNIIKVPTPVFCRPLGEAGMKIWCAAGVEKDSDEYDDEKSVNDDESLREKKEIYDDNHNDDNDDNKEKSVKDSSSSHIWVCASDHSNSKVLVFDAEHPKDILDSFYVCSSHLLCIASVPIHQNSDFPFYSPSLTETESKVSPSKSVSSPSTKYESPPVLRAEIRSDSKERELKQGSETNSSNMESTVSSSDKNLDDNDDFPDAVHRRFVKESPEKSFEKSKHLLDKYLMGPTIWLGSQSGWIYIHSSVSNWKTCIESIKLKDAVLCILHLRGRVLAACANGTIGIFHREESCKWNLVNYHSLDLGKPSLSIRTITSVYDVNVWAGYQNRIFVIEPSSLTVTHIFSVVPLKGSQIRQMAWIGDGVWVSVRLDSTLRLYHATTYSHLQDIDIAAYVYKMLGDDKWNLSSVHITSLLISCHRLWMGTGNGVIISLPLKSPLESKEHHELSEIKTPGTSVRVYSTNSFIPYCSISNAQLSFHGHRDAVKFFVTVPDKKRPGIPVNSMMVISGGEGYIDFRQGVNETSTSFQSHIMFWSSPLVSL